MGRKIVVSFWGCSWPKHGVIKSMIIKEKLDKPYEDYSTKSMIWIKCDYCGKELPRNKRSRILSNKNIDKDSCDQKSCKKNKKIEINEFLKKSKIHQEKMKEVIAVRKRKNLEKHGCENYFSSEEFKNKRNKSLLKKYGVTSLFLNQEILERYKATCIERYGVDNYAKHSDFYSKVIESNLKKYGQESSMLNKGVLEKRKKTSLDKFGKESYTQTEEYLINRRLLFLELYGVDHTSKLPSNRTKAKETCILRYGHTNYSKTEEFKKRFLKTCLDKYGVPNPLFLKKNQIYGKTQEEIKTWINSLGFNFEPDYSVMDGKELDLYDKNINVAIEYCGLFWHNELSLSPRLSLYHYEKYKKCQEKGIRLITIFEDEWKHQEDKCKGILMSILKKEQIKIYARKCNLKELSKKEFKQFCDSNHLQESNNLGLIFYGLFYEDDLIASMSFGRHHRNKSLLTLDRLCFKRNFNVVGGSSKLFKKCLEWARNNNYKKLIKWSDNRWSLGNVYKQLGFKLDCELKPDYSYVNYKKPNKRISKQSQAKNKNSCPINTTEREWCLELGLARIWDCGKKRWTYEIN